MPRDAQGRWVIQMEYFVFQRPRGQSVDTRRCSWMLVNHPSSLADGIKTLFLSPGYSWTIQIIPLSMSFHQRTVSGRPWTLMDVGRGNHSGPKERG